jgi:hypothetical protein
MLDKPRRRRQAPDVETNTGPDVLRKDPRPRDRRDTPPDSLPPRTDERPVEEPSDYEREINRLDTASFKRIANK